MAKGTGGNPRGEYAGTGGDGGEPVLGPSIDPATLAGGGADRSGGGDNGSGSGERDASGTEFDPRIHAGPDKRNADGNFARKRGRRAGGGSNAGTGRKSQGASSADLKGSIEALSKTLVIVHLGIAGATNTPELAIDKDEGDLLAKASANLMSEFDLTPDPKTQAIVGLVMAAATVYGPRAVMIRARKAQEKQEKSADENGHGMGGVTDSNGHPVGVTPFSVAQ